MTRSQFENYLDYVASIHKGKVGHIGQMGRCGRSLEYTGYLFWDHVAKKVIYTTMSRKWDPDPPLFGLDAIEHWERQGMRCREDETKYNYAEQMGLALLLEAST